MAYVFDFAGHGQFVPAGKVNVADTTAHNAAVEAQELAIWEGKPDRHYVYVGKVPLAADGRVGAMNESDSLYPVTTWLGTKLGAIYWARTTRNNFGARITSIRFRGTNGESYYGRFGSDNSQLCRVRRFK